MQSFFDRLSQCLTTESAFCKFNAHGKSALFFCFIFPIPLYNRYFLMETASARLREATRHNIPYSLIIVNIDKLKSINQNHGHSTGDIVLKEIASIHPQGRYRRSL